MEFGTIFTLKEGPEGNLNFNYADTTDKRGYYFNKQRGTYMAYPHELEVVDIGDDEALRQQILTQNVLNLVARREPSWNPLVSGGAPRDWDVGTKANDIDVWCKAGLTMGKDVRKSLERMFSLRVEIKLVSPKDYPTGEGYIEYIYSATIVGLEFQFIFVTDNSVEAVHNHVCASLSRIHFDHETLSLHPTRDYKESRKGQHIIYYDDKGCSPRVSYVNKMKKRYPEYTHHFHMLHDRYLAKDLEVL